MDTLAARAQLEDAVELMTPASAAGREWPVVIVPGLQEGVWPNTRLRGELLGSTLFADAVEHGVEYALQLDPLSRLREIRYDELRSFSTAVSRAREVLICTAVSSEDEQPSSFLDYVAPLRPGPGPARALPRWSVRSPCAHWSPNCASTPSSTPRPPNRGSRAVLGALATAEPPVPGAHPASWWGLARVVLGGAGRSAGRHRLRVAVEGRNRAEIAAGLVCPGRRRRGRHRLCPQPGHPGPRHRAGPAGCLGKRIRRRTRPALAHAGDEGQLGRQAGLPARRIHGPEARPVRPGDAQRGPEPGRRRTGLRGEAAGRSGGGRCRDRPDPTRRRRKHRAGAARRAPGPGRPAGDRRRGPAGRSSTSRPANASPAKRIWTGTRSWAPTRPPCWPAASRVPTTGRRRCRAAPSWPSSAPPPRAPASRPRRRWTRGELGPGAWSATPPGSCPEASSRPATIRPREATAATAAGSPKCARCACGESRLLNERRGAGDRPDRPASGTGSRFPHPFPSHGSARRSCPPLLGEKNSPTAEQSLIISSPLTPRLVIAGAGSGKTATMADRVVWLVANGWVRPEEVLGVTFTRKAAGELASRIRAKLAALAAHRGGRHREHASSLPGCSAPTRSNPRSPRTTRTPAASCPTTVSASASNATSCCSAAPSRSSSPARWWKPSTATTNTSGPPSRPWSRPSSSSPASALSICRTRPRSAAGCWNGSPSSSRCPTSPTAKKNPTQAAGELSAMLRTRASVADMVGRYSEAKRARGALDFGDLVALAARVANEIPVAAQTERQTLQGGAARRVPGHLARPAGAVLPAVRRRPCRHRGGGPEPVHLRVPRRVRRAALPLRPRIPGPASAAKALADHGTAEQDRPMAGAGTAPRALPWRRRRTSPPRGATAATSLPPPTSFRRRSARPRPEPRGRPATGKPPRPSRFRRCSPARPRSRAGW